MISTSTLAFALAFVAACCAAGALITCWRTALALDSSQSEHERASKTLEQSVRVLLAQMKTKLSELERQSPAKLGADVVALSAAVDSLRKTHQRFAGRFYQELQDAPPSSNGASSQIDILDPELAAELALQSAPQVSPGKR